MTIAVKGVLGLALAGELWFGFGQHASAAYLERRLLDVADQRPARSILMIGNSRTYYHHMPATIRRIADADHSPVKYEIEVDALPGASFESLWSDRRTRGLLREKWDDVVFQGESRGQSTRALTASFEIFGDKLLRSARLTRGAPRLVVNWTYDPILYENDADGSNRAVHMRKISYVHRLLADHSGARRIDVQGLWEDVRLTHPGLALTEDGNHPSAAGSYLLALATYADISGRRVSQLAYAPDDVPEAQAAILRRSVDAYRLSR